MRYGIMFTVKGTTTTAEERKVTVMDFQKTRMITFKMNEINGDEMEDDLKRYIQTQINKINSGYWDYSGKHKEG